jgi:hypothetical protein
MGTPGGGFKPGQPGPGPNPFLLLRITESKSYIELECFVTVDIKFYNGIAPCKLGLATGGGIEEFEEPWPGQPLKLSLTSLNFVRLSKSFNGKKTIILCNPQSSLYLPS